MKVKRKDTWAIEIDVPYIEGNSEVSRIYVGIGKSSALVFASQLRKAADELETIYRMPLSDELQRET